MKQSAFGRGSRFDPLGPGMPRIELWGESPRPRGVPRRKRGPQAAARRAAKRAAKRQGLTLKGYLRIVKGRS